MLVLPIESRTLLVLIPPVAQFKDKDEHEPATDRQTGRPADRCAAGGGVGRVDRRRWCAGVAGLGAPARGAEGSEHREFGAGDRVDVDRGEKNGRAWQIFRASALTAVKPG